MVWIWVLAALLVLIAGVRYRRRLGAGRSAGAPRVDDEAIRHIIGTGRLPQRERIDREEAARAEEEFWAESWDEPEEYRP